MNFSIFCYKVQYRPKGLQHNMRIMHMYCMYTSYNDRSLNTHQTFVLVHAKHATDHSQAVEGYGRLKASCHLILYTVSTQSNRTKHQQTYCMWSKEEAQADFNTFSWYVLSRNISIPWRSFDVLNNIRQSTDG